MPTKTITLEKEVELRDYIESQDFDNKSTKIVLSSIDDEYGFYRQ